MNYWSLCAGIECAYLAWHPLGWRPTLLCEIAAFPRAVLEQRLNALELRLGVEPGKVPLWCDLSTLRPRRVARFKAITLPQVLMAGTPCQSFSISGRRLGLADQRGNLALDYVRMFHAIPTLRWSVWENVRGVLSLRDNAFGCLLGGLVGADVPLVVPGGIWPDAGMVAGPLARAAWRVLDAQHFGVAQRRARVFVVTSPNASGRDPAAVLFERQSLRWDSAPGGQTKSDVAAGTARGAGSDGQRVYTSGSDDPIDVNKTLTAKGAWNDATIEGFVVHTLPAEHDASDDGSGRGQPLIVMPGQTPYDLAPTLCGNGQPANSGTGNIVPVIAPTLTGHHSASGRGQAAAPLIAFGCNDTGEDADALAPTLRAGNHDRSHANGGAGVGITTPAGSVRKLMPLEWERLMGMPDGWTDIIYKGKPARDAPRYKSIGNGIVIPQLRWIGERIQAWEAMHNGSDPS